MNIIETVLGKAATTATNAASDAAAAQAQAQYEKFKPLIWLAGFMAATVYLFFFLPRFRVPWHVAD